MDRLIEASSTTDPWPMDDLASERQDIEEVGRVERLYPRVVVGRKQGVSPVPEATAAGFRECFFFSFLGFMVSVLGFVLRLPFAPCALTLGANDSFCMFSTFSVSTVIFLEELSPVVCPLLPNFTAVLDCLLWSNGGRACVLDRRVAALTLPLSLPLSALCENCSVLIIILSAFLSTAPFCDVA